MTHQQNIEGDWNNFSIRIVQTADVANILKFIVEHGNDPIRSLAPQPDEKCGDPKLAKLLESEEVRSLSLVAVDRTTNEIAGVNLQFIWRKEDAFRVRETTDEPIPVWRKAMNLVQEKFDRTKLGLFERYGVEFVVWNCLVAVCTKHRKRGLASELYSRMVALLRGKKLPVVFSTFTSPYSRRAAEKEGFVEMDRVYFHELRDGNGEPVLPAASQNDFASVMVLEL